MVTPVFSVWVFKKSALHDPFIRGVDFRWRLRGKLQFELCQHNSDVVVRLCVAAQDDVASVGCGQMHVNHLDRAELVDDRAGRESCGDVVCLVAQRDVKAVCEEADEDVRFDAIVALMPDRADAKVAFEIR